MKIGIETDLGYKREPKFKTIKRAPRKVGGLEHAEISRRRIEQAELLAEEELITAREEFRFAHIGGSLQDISLIPETIPIQEQVEIVLFPEATVDAPTTRSGDLAKKRGEIINTWLEDPWAISRTSGNLSFWGRHLPRIVRFARTLRNKGKLHPGIDKILDQ